MSSGYSSWNNEQNGSFTANYNDFTQYHRKSFIDVDIPVVYWSASRRSAGYTVPIIMIHMGGFHETQNRQSQGVGSCSIIFIVAHSLVIINDLFVPQAHEQTVWERHTGLGQMSG